jgi:molybdopterin synthase catalytic subunit
MKRVSVQQADFDPGQELAVLEQLGVGGVASFTGVCRGDDGVLEMMLEHYPGMTEKALNRLAEEAERRWSLAGVILIHRVGTLCPGDRIVLVATASLHRAAALESCAFLIDQLKTSAPFWKKERRGSGEGWVEARDSDDEAASRWEACLR